MEQSLYFEWVKKFFPQLVLSLAEKVNGSRQRYFATGVKIKKNEWTGSEVAGRHDADELNRAIGLRLADVRRALNNVQETAGGVCQPARLSRAYTDISGNLRSSISFCVARNGSISRIAPRKVFMNGEEGAYRAERLLKKLAASSGSSPTLYIVAAMPYARYVEATGRDVTISATILAAEA